MPDYLSDGWLDALDAAVRDSDSLRHAAAAVTLTLQQIVQWAEHEPVCWAIVLDQGSAHVAKGQVEHPDVTFTSDRDTAITIATGKESAQQAFVAGRLRLGGDARVLLEHQNLLAELDDVTASVRAATVF